MPMTFYVSAPLTGWEDPACELRGHFLGHYLSSLALAHRSSGGDAAVAERLKYLVDELSKVRQ